jgi:hypothetical protein
MSKSERRYTGRPFCGNTICRKIVYQMNSLQTPHGRLRSYSQAFTVSRRVSLCISRRGSLSLEASMVLPIFLCMITALLYLFALIPGQAKIYRTLTERAQMLAVTATASETDPYIRLYNSQRVRLPFSGYFPGGKAVVHRVIVRSWVGYTGESFNEAAGDSLVYLTPEGEVYHRSADCTYLLLTVRSLSYTSVSAERNLSGEKYSPCEYCVRNGVTGGTVYITDYGAAYHTVSNCRGLKRTIMAVPVSEIGSRRSCSRCGAAS